MITETDCHDKKDVDLVRLTLGSEDYFFCLMKKYEAPLLRYIQRISGFDDAAAADILQDSYIKIYQNLHNFDKNQKFSSWAYRIVHNVTISHYRKSKVRPESINFEDNSFIENFTSEIDLEREINDKLNKQSIAKLLGELDIKYREVLVLYFMEDKSYAEISDILHKPEGTVATLISRAKTSFKKIVEKKDFQL